MFEAAAKALSQMFTQPFRAVLLKSIALAVAFLAVIVIVLFRLLEWLSGSGVAWLDGLLGASAHGALVVIGWIVAIALGIGLFAGAVLLMPAVTALVASVFVDEIAALVEQFYYPADPPGKALPFGPAIVEGVKAGLLAIAVYICAAPFLLLAGIGFVLFFLATAWLLGREYFELVAMRFHSVEDAKQLRRLHHATVFTAGLFIAAFVSIPILNLATPLFGTAFMVHVYKRLSGASRSLLIDPPPDRMSLSRDYSR